MMIFFTQVAEHYPVLLVAEALVLLTFGLVGYFLRRLAMPLGERYVSWYRKRRTNYLLASIEHFDALLEDGHLRTRALVYRGMCWIFFSIASFASTFLVLYNRYVRFDFVRVGGTLI